MDGNDTPPHLKLSGEVCKPLNAEMSEILVIRPKFRIELYYANFLCTVENIFLTFANYQIIILLHTKSTIR